jgi:hypothetical protein
MFAGEGADDSFGGLFPGDRVAGFLEGGLFFVRVAAKQFEQAFVLTVLGAVHFGRVRYIQIKLAITNPIENPEKKIEIKMSVSFVMTVG